MQACESTPPEGVGKTSSSSPFGHASFQRRSSLTTIGASGMSRLPALLFGGPKPCQWSTRRRTWITAAFSSTSARNTKSGREAPLVHTKREVDGGLARNRTGVHGFAVRCVTTPPRGRSRLRYQRDWGITSAPLRADDAGARRIGYGRLMPPKMGRPNTRRQPSDGPDGARSASS
jgi:hypothetical protein